MVMGWGSREFSKIERNDKIETMKGMAERR